LSQVERRLVLGDDAIERMTHGGYRFFVLGGSIDPPMKLRTSAMNRG
jgi:hypothetical protein